MSTSHPIPGHDGQTPIICRPAAISELPTALAMILGSAGRPVPLTQVAEFVQSATQRRIILNFTWVAFVGGELVWAALPIVSPGKTLLMLAPSNMPDSTIPAASQLVNHVCDYFTRRDVHLAQVLLDPQHIQTRKFFAGMGFAEIAELIYLNGFAPRSLKPPQFPHQISLLSYSPQTHALFAEAIVNSYRDSLDCPALSGLRDIDDIIAGHQATGEFDPAFWQLLVEQDRPRGVLLLSRIPNGDAAELVYLGLTPEARGRGFGILLMQQAWHLIASDQRHRLSLAVDSNNTPALKLYLGLGMQRVAARYAMIRALRPGK